MFPIFLCYFNVLNQSSEASRKASVSVWTGVSAVLLTPVEALCDMAGTSVAEAAANMERGSVPSSMELRGSGGAEEEEEEDEEVLPLRAPRRVFVSVTWVERRGEDQSC